MISITYDGSTTLGLTHKIPETLGMSFALKAWGGLSFYIPKPVWPENMPVYKVKN
jgi:hypothetical protein